MNEKIERELNLMKLAISLQKDKDITHSLFTEIDPEHRDQECKKIQDRYDEVMAELKNTQ